MILALPLLMLRLPLLLTTYYCHYPQWGRRSSAMPLSTTRLEVLRIILLTQRFLLEEFWSGGVGVERIFLVEFLWEHRVLADTEYDHLILELLD